MPKALKAARHKELQARVERTALSWVLLEVTLKVISGKQLKLEANTWNMALSWVGSNQNYIKGRRQQFAGQHQQRRKDCESEQHYRHAW